MRSASRAVSEPPRIRRTRARRRVGWRIRRSREIAGPHSSDSRKARKAPRPFRFERKGAPAPLTNDRSRRAGRSNSESIADGDANGAGERSKTRSERQRKTQGDKHVKRRATSTQNAGRQARKTQGDKHVKRRAISTIIRRANSASNRSGGPRGETRPGQTKDESWPNSNISLHRS